MSDLITAVGHHPIALTVVCTSGVLLIAVAVGVAANHEAEIRTCWARAGRLLTEFSVWVMDAAPAAGASVLGAACTALVWLLEHVLRAHGEHRAGVA